MNKYFLSWLLLALLCLGGAAYAQQPRDFQQGDRNRLTDEQMKELQERVGESESFIKRQKLLNLFINVQANFSPTWINSKFEFGNFTTNQLRLDYVGRINDHITYRLRQRLNRSNVANQLENLSFATDIAQVTYHFNDQWFATFGKQPEYAGGIEFDMNPIDIYEYSLAINNIKGFLTGVSVGHVVNNQEFVLQMVNSDNEYITNLPPNVIRDKIPLGYTANWNGNFLDKQIQTRWSFSNYQVAKSNNAQYLALGQLARFGKFIWWADYMSNWEDLDRKGVGTSILQNSGIGLQSGLASNLHYTSVVSRVTFLLNDMVELMAEGIFDHVNFYRNTTYGDATFSKGNFLYEHWSAQGGVEFYPITKDRNFRLHAVAVYNSYNVRQGLQLPNNRKDDVTVYLGVRYRFKIL